MPRGGVAHPSLSPISSLFAPCHPGAALRDSGKPSRFRGTRHRMPPTPLFEIRNLAKVYRMGEVEVHALRQVTLTLNEAEFVVLLGPSGSGKSTLLNIIGGLDVPT